MDNERNRGSLVWRVARDGHDEEGIVAGKGLDTSGWVNLQRGDGLGARKERQLFGRQRVPGGRKVLHGQVEGISHVAVIVESQADYGGFTGGQGKLGLIRREANTHGHFGLLSRAVSVRAGRGSPLEQGRPEDFLQSASYLATG